MMHMMVEGGASLMCMQVEYDSAVVGARDIINRVRGLGYEASPVEADDISAGASPPFQRQFL